MNPVEKRLEKIHISTRYSTSFTFKTEGYSILARESRVIDNRVKCVRSARQQDYTFTRYARVGTRIIVASVSGLPTNANGVNCANRNVCSETKNEGTRNATLYRPRHRASRASRFGSFDILRRVMFIAASPAITGNGDRKISERTTQWNSVFPNESSSRTTFDNGNFGLFRAALLYPSSGKPGGTKRINCPRKIKICYSVNTLGEFFFFTL